MAANSSFEQLGILVVDEDDEFLNDAKQMFEGRVPAVRSLADAQRRVAEGEVDVVFLGPTYAHDSALRDVAVLLEQDPELAVILVAGTITAPLLRAALRLGLRDVIEAPLTMATVSETIAHVDESRRRRPVSPQIVPTAGPSQGKVVTVMSAKGGSGKTVAATNLALLLAARTDPSRVVLVDADLQFGDVCLVLQLEPKLTVVNAAHEIHRLDDPLLESLLTKHPSGLRVLAAPLEPAFADEVSTAALTEIIQMLRGMFDYVIVDTASLLDELLLSLLERSDQVLLVVDMDLPSVKNAKLALETLRLLKYPASKIDIVLNRSNAKARLDAAEIERSLQMKIAGTIPSDGMIPASVNEGVPVVLSSPKSKVARSFESVFHLVVDARAPGAAAAAEPSSRESKRRWL